MDKLKRCPFCGSEAELALLFGRFGITCTGCHACILPHLCQSDEIDERRAAIDEWNRRVVDRDD